MIAQRLRLLFVMLAIALCGSAGAEIVLVTGIGSAIDQVSRQEAEQLYLGRLSALKDGTPVKLLDLPPGPARDAFYRRLIGKNTTQTRAYWSRMVFTGRARPPHEVASNDELRQQLQRDRNLIGYLPADELAPELRVLLRLP